MGSARSIWDAAKHPRGGHGYFSQSGAINRKRHPDAVRSGRLELKVSKTKVVLDEAGPLSTGEGPWFFKRGKAQTRSRFSGGRKSTTKFNTTAIDFATMREVVVPRKKIMWRH